MKYLVTIFTFFIFENLFAQSTQFNNKGSKLFRYHCSMCHDLNNIIIGPPLKGIFSKYNDKWIREFILDAPTMVERNDSLAVIKFITYDQKIHPVFKKVLTKKELKQILDFIKNS